MGAILKFLGLGCLIFFILGIVMAAIFWNKDPGVTASGGAPVRIVIDSQKVESLKPFFTTREDEFEDFRWHVPKSAPKNIGQNGIYCQFVEKDGEVYQFTLSVQYVADDWLFIEEVKLNIDSLNFSIRPDNVESHVGDAGTIMEWFDHPINDANVALILALASAKSAKMKIEGRQFSKVKTITQSQIKDISRSLDLYRAMGGKF